MRKKIVLVVDDEPVNRIFASRVLSNAGWHAVEAVDGDAAIAAARADNPDLIVMDINMPGTDGWQATRAIRAEAPPLGSVPILAYTTLRLTSDDVRDAGMDGLVPKPCTPEQLVAVANRWRVDGEMTGLHRLSDIFGAEELGGLVTRFRTQLVDAVGRLDRGDASLAHRIAGVAGTLGFIAVSASWLAISEGDDSARDQARRDARIAITAIDRDEDGLASA